MSSSIAARPAVVDHAGDGIVSFGVALVTQSFTNPKSRARIGSFARHRPLMSIAAGVNSMSPRRCGT